MIFLQALYAVLVAERDALQLNEAAERRLSAVLSAERQHKALR